MRWYSWVWAILFGLGFGFEALVLVLGIPGATLTEHIVRIRDANPWGVFSLFIAFLLWLVAHLIFYPRAGSA